MLDPMLELFDIRPDYDLNVMRPSQTLTTVTKSALGGLELIFAEADPDWILVQGDTTTVMAASMAAFFPKVSVGHVAAGGRALAKRRSGACRGRGWVLGALASFKNKK